MAQMMSVRYYATPALFAECNNLCAYVKQLDAQSSILYAQYNANPYRVSKNQLSLQLRYIERERRKAQRRIMALQKEYNRRCGLQYR